MKSLPITASRTSSTPSFFIYSTSLSTIVFGSLNSGIPYMRTPPGLCNASNIVTSWPNFMRSAAQVRPPGPEPMTATFLPVGDGFSDIAISPDSRS